MLHFLFLPRGPHGWPESKLETSHSADQGLTRRPGFPLQRMKCALTSNYQRTKASRLITLGGPVSNISSLTTQVNGCRTVLLFAPGYHSSPSCSCTGRLSGPALSPASDEPMLMQLHHSVSLLYPSPRDSGLAILDHIFKYSAAQCRHLRHGQVRVHGGQAISDGTAESESVGGLLRLYRCRIGSRMEPTTLRTLTGA